jgi:hypothetical protein
MKSLSCPDWEPMMRFRCARPAEGFANGLRLSLETDMLAVAGRGGRGDGARECAELVWTRGDEGASGGSESPACEVGTSAWISSHRRLVRGEASDKE